jgi:hypothetical protein
MYLVIILFVCLQVHRVSSSCLSEIWPYFVGGTTYDCEFQKFSIFQDGVTGIASGICSDTSTELGMVSIFDTISDTHLASYTMTGAEAYMICESEDLSGSYQKVTCLYMDSNKNAAVAVSILVDSVGVVSVS